MPQKSSFFDSAPGDERYYPAREFAEYFTQFIGNGIFKGGTTLKVTATGKDANVSLAVGHGWINGYKYTVYDAPLVLPIQPATTQDRIDRIVLRLDTSAPVRAVQALVLQGTAASSPVAPGIVRSGDIYDLSLAQVRIKANSSIVLPENITDERLNNTVCGVVTGVVQQADTTTIFNQFQSWLNTKTAEYQQQWNDFMKSIEDSGFASTLYVDNRVLTGGYGVTTNSGNDYSVTPVPAPATLVEGLKVTIKINVANTGAATLNVKGLGKKSILKANGTALTSGSLKANSVYTLVYNGTAFILQGEGGGGTAGPGDVRSTKTATNNDGEFTGTLVTRATGATTIIPTLVDQVLQAGIYDGAITVKPGRKFAKGNELTDSNGLLSVPSGLGFRPKNLIVIRWSGSHTGVYTEDLTDSLNNNLPFNYLYEQSGGVFVLNKGRFTILNDGFTLKTDRDLGDRFYYYATN